MKIGCCISMLASTSDPIGLNYLDDVKAIGFDYVDLPLAELMQLSDAEFTALLKRLEALDLRCESCNNFFPEHIRLTGEARDPEQIRAYLSAALPRAIALNVRSIVFGSAKAKNVPAGFPMDTAWLQVEENLQIISDALDGTDIAVAIEPVCARESNILLTYKEGCRLAEKINRKNIRCLVDLYHLSTENEPASNISDGGEQLQHVHIARPDSRIYPKENDGFDYSEFFNALKEANYDSGVSIEAFTDCFVKDASESLQFLKKFCQE